ncbi:hypothetical protein WJX84_009297 [Apatococcus fuscideae]|uniref:PHD-type domain-containing protein n=1 Tax=Apatococcus fuscideae TaxID=2026836 RepID=A0AAW1T7J6_9CHLO
MEVAPEVSESATQHAIGNLPELVRGSKRNLQLIYLRQRQLDSLWNLHDKLERVFTQHGGVRPDILPGILVKFNDDVSGKTVLRRVVKASEEGMERIVYVEQGPGGSEDDYIPVSDLANSSMQQQEVDEIEAFWDANPQLGKLTTWALMEKCRVLQSANVLKGQWADPALPSLWQEQRSRPISTVELLERMDIVRQGQDPSTLPIWDVGRPADPQGLQAEPMMTAVGHPVDDHFHQDLTHGASAQVGMLPLTSPTRPTLTAALEESMALAQSPAVAQVVEPPIPVCGACSRRGRLMECNGEACEGMYHAGCAGYADPADVPANWVCPACRQAQGLYPLVMPSCHELRRTSGEAFIRLPSGNGPSQEHQAYVRAQISPAPTQEEAESGHLVVSQCNVSRSEQAASLNGTRVHQSSLDIWHGTMDFAAWHEEANFYYPKICCRPIGTSSSRFADDMNSSPALHEGFKQLLLQPQQARFIPQAGDAERLRIVCLQTKGDGHYRYFCPFACQPRLGQVQHTTGRKALEQHLISDHLEQLRTGSSQLLYVEPQAIVLSNCPGLVMGPLIPLRGRLCRFDLSAKASQTDGKVRMGLGGLLDTRTYSSPSLSPASSSDGADSAERASKRTLASFVDDGAVDSFRPTPTVTSIKKQTNTTKCGRCLTCRTPSRKQACLIGRCKDLAEKGSATARLASQGNDLKGKWLRLRKADGHIIAIVTDYDPYRHQHQLASGGGTFWRSLQSDSCKLIEPTPQEDMPNKLRYGRKATKEMTSGGSREGAVFVACESSVRKWWPVIIRCIDRPHRAYSIQLRCRKSQDETGAEQSMEIRTMLDPIPLQRHHAFFTLDKHSTMDYTLACPKIPEQVVSEFARARGGSAAAAPIVKANLAVDAADWDPVGGKRKREPHLNEAVRKLQASARSPQPAQPEHDGALHSQIPGLPPGAPMSHGLAGLGGTAMSEDDAILHENLQADLAQRLRAQQNNISIPGLAALAALPQLQPGYQPAAAPYAPPPLILPQSSPLARLPQGPSREPRSFTVPNSCMFPLGVKSEQASGAPDLSSMISQLHPHAVSAAAGAAVASMGMGFVPHPAGAVGQRYQLLQRFGSRQWSGK